MREAIGLALRLRMDEQERDVSRLTSGSSRISRTPPWRPWASRARRSWRCSSRCAARFPTRCSASPTSPPVSDGSGSDRALLKRANELLLAAGCKRDGGVLKLPNGEPLDDRVPRFLRRASAAHDAVPAEPEEARHRRAFAHRRRGAIQEPHRRTSISTSSPRRSAASMTPGAELRIVSTARRGDDGRVRATSPASPIPRRRAGREDRPTRRRATSSMSPAASLDRVLRAGHYWVPMWYHDAFWSPIGTRSRGPSASRNSASARPTPGGGTKTRRRKLGCEQMARHWRSRRIPLAPLAGRGSG